MKRRITKHFFTFLFLISCVFVTQAAKVVFYNQTEKPLVITYDNKTFTIEAGKNKDFLPTFFRRHVPFRTELIEDLTFKLKIGDGDLKDRTIEHFIEPYGRIDTETAISGCFTRNIYIKGYNDDEIEEQIVEDEAGLIKSGANAFMLFASIFIKNDPTTFLRFTSPFFESTISRYASLKKEKIKVDRSHILSGTTVNLKSEDTSIRKLSETEELACKGEKRAVAEREKIAKKAQEKFLDIKFLEDEIPLSVAFCGSGGGVRARISTTGFVKGVIDESLFDCATYFSALSGSSWMLAPWVIRKKGMQMDDFIENIVNDSKEENNNTFNIPIPTVHLIDLKDMKDDCFRQGAWDRPHGLVNLFGVVLQRAIFKGVVDKSENSHKELYLSSIRDEVESGSAIIPIFEIRAERKESGKIIIHEPCFFTPWEFGGRYFGKNGACINIKTFGSKFEESDASTNESMDSNKLYFAGEHNISEHIIIDGKKVEPMIGPEPDLGLITATCGSAFTVPSCQGPKGQAQQNIDQTYMLKHGLFNNSLINCEFNNFMHKKDYFEGYDNKPLLYLHDAGIVANLPIISLYRRPTNIAHGIEEGDAPDIIFVFDASDTSGGTIGEELLNNKMEMMKKGLPFPNIEEETVTNKNTKQRKRQLKSALIAKIKKNGGFYIFDENPDKRKYKDWQIPTVIYMTLVQGQKYTLPNGDEFVFDFKNFGTFNFKYDEKTCRNLIGMTESIIKKNISSIKAAMGKRRKINEIRSSYAIEKINKSEKPRPIDQAIEKLNESSSNLKPKCEVLEKDIALLAGRHKMEGGTPGEDIRDFKEEKLLVSQKERTLDKMQLMGKQAETAIKTNKSIREKALNSDMLEIEKSALEAKLKIAKLELKKFKSELKAIASKLETSEPKLKAFNLDPEAYKLDQKKLGIIPTTAVLIMPRPKSLELELEKLTQKLKDLEPKLNELELTSKLALSELEKCNPKLKWIYSLQAGKCILDLESKMLESGLIVLESRLKNIEPHLKLDSYFQLIKAGLIMAPTVMIVANLGTIFSEDFISGESIRGLKLLKSNYNGLKICYRGMIFLKNWLGSKKNKIESLKNELSYEKTELNAKKSSPESEALKSELKWVEFMLSKKDLSGKTLDEKILQYVKEEKEKIKILEDRILEIEHLQNPRPLELRQHENPPVQNIAYGQSSEEIVINE